MWLKHAGLTRKIGTNQVRVIRVMLTGTQEDMKRIAQEGRLKAWCADNLAWLRKTFGAENVVSAVLHMDETTPHIHAAVVPIVTGERRKLRKPKTDESDKRKYRTKSTARPRLCADDVMSRVKLKEYQDKQYEKHVSLLKAIISKTTTWFPYFREMIRMESVCRTAGFDDEQTATLLKGKPLEYSGELYSEEHDYKFTVERVTAQITPNPFDKRKLQLNINKIPFGMWRRGKCERLRQITHFSRHGIKL